MKKFLKWLILILVLLCIGVAIWQSTLTPSNTRDWQEQYAVLPYADFNNNLVTIHNVRNFQHPTATEQIPGYYDKTYDLNELQKVYFIVEGYSKFRGAAHTFLSFQFANNTFVDITVEARLEKGENYTPLAGLFRQYELMYVIGDERDVILQRTMAGNRMYLYPARTTTAKAQQLFSDMLMRANSLKDKPTFYNTITDSCTTAIVHHVNKITPKKIPFSYKYLLPGYSDELADSVGLLDINVPLEEARKIYYITDRAQKAGDSPDFSVKIREL